MNFKLFISGTLAVVIAAGFWLWLRQPQPVAAPMPLVARQATAPAPQPFHSHPVQMKVVSRQPATAPGVSLTASDWPAVKMIVDVGVGYQERLNAVASLSARLTAADWAVLQKFLVTPDALDNGQLGQVIKNELLDKLCSLAPPPPGLGEVLAQMYRDQAQNDVIRDYAVQHMSACYEQLDPQTTEAINVQKTLWEATIETRDSIGGTALLALQRLSQETAGLDQAKIASRALQMARDGSAGELTLITAYQVCAQLQVADALPLVLDAVQKGGTVPVKMSAIGALGLLGGQEQIPLLNSLGDEARLQPAVQHALAQIAARSNPTASRN